MAENENTKKDIAGGKGDSQRAAITGATADAPAGGSGATAGAYDSAANRNTAIALINNNKARIGEIETALKRVGLLP